jgi:ketosteroid isomerase-like protein
MENLRDVGGIRFEPTSFETRGDVIVSEWVGHGVGHASGAPFEWQTFAVIHMRDRKILRAQGFLDRAQALEAAGPGAEVTWEPLARNDARSSSRPWCSCLS